MQRQQQKSTAPVSVRWCIRMDYPELEAIDERASCPWGIDRIVDAVSQRNVICRVAECQFTAEVIGFEISRLTRSQADFLYLSVLPAARRLGIASALIRAQQDRVTLSSMPRRQRVVCECPAGCIDLAETLAANRFRVRSVDHARDVYEFFWLPIFKDDNDAGTRQETGRADSDR